MTYVLNPAHGRNIEKKNCENKQKYKLTYVKRHFLCFVLKMNLDNF